MFFCLSGKTYSAVFLLLTSFQTPNVKKAKSTPDLLADVTTCADDESMISFLVLIYNDYANL